MALVDNLVSYWKLDEASGIRNDAHASNNLTDNNTVGSATGIINNGADFEASNSESLSIADGSQSGLDITGDMTLSLWYKPESQPATDTDNHLVSKSGDGSNQSYYLVHRDSGGTTNLRFRISANGSAITSKEINQTFSNGTIYHIVVSYDASAGTADCYVDGSSIGTMTGFPTSIFDGNGAFSLGADNFNGSPRRFVDGIVDEVGIWNRTTTSGEASELYNSGNGLAYSVLSLISFTISESLSVSETTTNLRGLITTTSESLSVSETISALKGLSFTIAESLGLIESYAFLRTRLFTITESLGLIEVRAYLQKKWSNVAKSTVATVTNGVKTAVSVITNRPKS